MTGDEAARSDGLDVRSRDLPGVHVGGAAAVRCGKCASKVHFPAYLRSIFRLQMDFEFSEQVGLLSAVNVLFESWATYGHPFDCHLIGYA